MLRLEQVHTHYDAIEALSGGGGAGGPARRDRHADR